MTTSQNNINENVKVQDKTITEFGNRLRQYILNNTEQKREYRRIMNLINAATPFCEMDECDVEQVIMIIADNLAKEKIYHQAIDNQKKNAEKSLKMIKEQREINQKLFNDCCDKIQQAEKEQMRLFNEQK